jgi:GT2 family glycosyltransferase
MNESLNFAAFIMTYQRVATLESTIKALLNQSCPPQKILIVDNDPDKSAEVLLSKFSNILVEYHPVGYNSGPAGAAKIGLEILSTQGYKWIGWIDDDDPPIYNDTFEILLKKAELTDNCGCVGVVGQFFNKGNGLMVRVPDDELEGNGVLEVDTIAGGMCKIVRAEVCSKGKVFPDTSFFYGFEELDFDLRMQEAGYVLVVDKELYKRHRVKFNRIGLQVKRGQKKDKNRIWRDYYSIRNSLIIQQKNKLFSAFFITIMRSVLKIISGFRYGVTYGNANARVILHALIHFLLGKRGKVSI